jgi:RNA polymerase sigma-70 factor (ECF subfamily)
LKVSRKFADKSREMIEKMQLNEEALNELDFSKIDLDAIEKIICDTLETLPERCREVFMLSRYDHLKNREIADKLGITLKAVEGNITRALKIFQVSLRDYLPSGFLMFLLQ